MKTTEELEVELKQQEGHRAEVAARLASAQEELKVTDKMIRALRDALALARGEPGQPLEKRVLAALVNADGNRMAMNDVATLLGTNRNTVAVCVHRHRYTARLDVDGQLWSFTSANPTKGVLKAERTEVDESQARILYAKELALTAREIKKRNRSAKGKEVATAPATKKKKPSKKK